MCDSVYSYLSSFLRPKTYLLLLSSLILLLNDPTLQCLPYLVCDTYPRAQLYLQKDHQKLFTDMQAQQL